MKLKTKLCNINRLYNQHTKDLEDCRDGGAKGRTLVGASFSIECRLCGECRLSGCDVAETGRNFGGAGDKKKEEERKTAEVVMKQNILLALSW